MDGKEIKKLLVVLEISEKYRPNKLEISICRQELEKLLKYKEKCEELERQNKQLNQDAEIGKALKWAIKTNYTMDMKDCYDDPIPNTIVDLLYGYEHRESED